MWLYLARKLYCEYAGCIARLRQFSKLTMQANLHDMQARLHNVFATRVDCQYRLQFFLLLIFFCLLAFFFACLWFFLLACGFFVGVVGILPGASGTVYLKYPYVYSTYLRSPIKRIITYFFT
jgi:hypothetical protein